MILHSGFGIDLYYADSDIMALDTITSMTEFIESQQARRRAPSQQANNRKVWLELEPERSIPACSPKPATPIRSSH
jgi:hypothetical protein